MKIIYALMLTGLMALIQGCSDDHSHHDHDHEHGTKHGSPTLDTSNDEAMKASVDKMTAGMSEMESRRFRETLVGIRFVVVKHTFKSGEAKDEAIRNIRNKMNGMTVDELYAFADEFHEKYQTLKGAEERIKKLISEEE